MKDSIQLAIAELLDYIFDPSDEVGTAKLDHAAFEAKQTINEILKVVEE